MQGTSRLAAALVVFFVLGMVPARNAAAQDLTQPTPSEAPDSTSSPLLDEPAAVGDTVEFLAQMLGHVNKSGSRSGFYPVVGEQINGAGLSGGPGYRRVTLDDRLRAEVSASISSRAYKAVQATVEQHFMDHSRFTLGAQADWRDSTQVSYFGVGPHTSTSTRTEYRVQDFGVDEYATLRANSWLAVTGQLGWEGRPTLLAPTGPFDAGYPDIRRQFDESGAPGVAQPASFIHAGLSLLADGRDNPRYQTRGGLLQASVTTFADRDGGTFSFQQYELEAAQFVPLFHERWVLSARARAVASNTAEGREVPFYLMPSLGGSNTLRSYSDYRFHDRDLLLASAESRWPLLEHLDTIVFVDAGNVSSRVGDLNLRHTSYGVGLQVHTSAATVARLDIADGPEGWRVRLTLDDPLRVRLHRIARLPFVP